MQTGENIDRQHKPIKNKNQAKNKKLRTRL